MRLDQADPASLELPEGKVDVILFDDRLTGFGLRLRRKTSGATVRSWVAQYRNGRHTRRFLIGSTEKVSERMARKKAKEVLGAAATGCDPQHEKRAARAKEEHSFQSVAADYLSIKQRELRPKTFYDAKRYLTGESFKVLHNRPIAQIERADIASCITAISRTAPVAAARARANVSALFAWAMGEGLVERNPVIGSNRPAEPPSRDRVLSDLELASLWRSCGGSDYGKVIRLMILLGARRREIGDMCRPEIDLEKAQWSLPASRAKNATAHVLPLPESAIAIIESVPQRIGIDYLFGSGRRGFTDWSRNKVLLDGRLGMEAWRLHDIRRSVATRMADIGIQPHIIEEILNHRSGHKRGVAGIYNRSVYANEVRDAMLRWDDHVRSIIEGGEHKVVAFERTVHGIA